MMRNVWEHDRHLFHAACDPYDKSPPIPLKDPLLFPSPVPDFSDELLFGDARREWKI